MSFMERLRRMLPSTVRSKTSSKGDRFKWYFALNESGSEGELGLHAKLAVLSARRNTRLEPHLITTGFRNEFTGWMEAHGVTLVDANLPLADVIESAAEKGVYHRRYIGHWLRCEIPLLETDEEFVLYTDADVVFLKGPRLRSVRPPFFACAPEYRIDGANYVNTGVMVMNVPSLRASAAAFLAHVSREISQVGGDYHDQHAYNRFYRGQWSPLDPALNAKPYWPRPGDAAILHFHGARLKGIRMLLDGQAEFDDPWWRTVGSLVASYRTGYVEAVRALLAATAGEPLPERPWIEAIAADLERAPPPVPADAIDLTFLDFRLFPD